MVNLGDRTTVGELVDLDIFFDAIQSTLQEISMYMKYLFGDYFDGKWELDLGFVVRDLDGKLRYLGQRIKPDGTVIWPKIRAKLKDGIIDYKQQINELTATTNKLFGD